MCRYCGNDKAQITVSDKTFPDDWIVYTVDDESQIHLDKDWKNKEFFC